METAIFCINLEGVPVGNLRHIIFPLRGHWWFITAYLLPTSHLDLLQWISNTQFLTNKVLLIFQIAGHKKNIVSLSGRLTAYGELNTKASICEVDRAGMRGKKMGKNENVSYFQVFRQQNWKREQQQFTLLPKDNPLESGRNAPVNDFWCKSLS